MGCGIFIKKGKSSFLYGFFPVFPLGIKRLSEKRLCSNRLNGLFSSVDILQAKDSIGLNEKLSGHFSCVTCVCFAFFPMWTQSASAFELVCIEPEGLLRVRMLIAP